ncbi:hypothetical protein EVG20_g10981 [Dentipellis fragilis]|uniref:Uncharacterized protein n=1 Tax=Dentipellis fragilis TaxID=205917 RepID=A0A4Y9XN28_9AGAM|nr:hypothetical protein EVG20_g10981 [Dentipellis fragilis]
MRGAHSSSACPKSEPPYPWRAVTRDTIDRRIATLADYLLTDDALAAETARVVSGWHSDGIHLPPPSSGLHAAFILDTNDRKETRERLIVGINDMITALERSCGVGAVFIAFHGEQGPDEARISAAEASPQRNVRLHTSLIFMHNQYLFDASIDDLEKICQQQLWPAYLRDFRLRIKQSISLEHSLSHYNRQSLLSLPSHRAPMLQQILNTPPSFPKHPVDPCYSHPFMLSAINVIGVAHGFRRRPGITQYLGRSLVVHVHGVICQHADHIVCFPEDANQPSPTFVFCPRICPASSEDKAPRVLEIYRYVARENAAVMLAGVGFNRGTASALAFLMDA